MAKTYTPPPKKETPPFIDYDPNEALLWVFSYAKSDDKLPPDNGRLYHLVNRETKAIAAFIDYEDARDYINTVAADWHNEIIVGWFLNIGE